jgi:hypothetical protein
MRHCLTFTLLPPPTRLTRQLFCSSGNLKARGTEFDDKSPCCRENSRLVFVSRASENLASESAAALLCWSLLPVYERSSLVRCALQSAYTRRDNTLISSREHHCLWLSIRVHLSWVSSVILSGFTYAAWMMRQY